MSEIVSGVHEIQTEAKKFVFEKLIPPLRLKIVESPSSDEAKALDNKGKWAEAADHFYTLSQIEKDPGIKADNLIDLSQILINLTRFGQAKEFLSKAEMLSSLGTEKNKNLFLKARVNEKLAWISDYEGDYEGSLARLAEAQESLEKISETGDLENKVENVLSTVTHFKGRAHFGLGSQGKNIQENINQSVSFFNLDLESFREMRQNGNPKPANEGYQHGWLARCHITLGDFSKAKLELEETKKLFEEFTQLNPDSGILAHYYDLQGELFMKQGRSADARSSFEASLGVRYTKERYPMGETRSLLAIALTHWAEGNLGKAGFYVLKALGTLTAKA
ncbi:MAG TPA: hypothetical protein VL401_03970 [Alphaproteobacteria bacterium]|jgi:tetratricopeptide (TPR) repeat protein|nr:hypothetical protein [Alphaproteobacteria bacterium]